MHRLSPNRDSRRWGTDRLVRTLLTVLADYRAAHPDAARVGVGDLSRRHGGDFGRRYGGLGHASHQNGLDVDVYYPRTDGAERRAYTPSLVDRELSQELVDRFLDAGAHVVYVGPRVGLQRPAQRVVPLVHHDDHLHVRLPLRSTSAHAGSRARAVRRPPYGSPATTTARAASGPEESRCWISTSDWTSSGRRAATGACAWSRARRARAWCSTDAPSCCCARATRSGSPTTRGCARRPPTRRCAGASARARRAWRRGR